nr:hypothetical protein [Tanacetum cinerariifolium]
PRKNLSKNSDAAIESFSPSPILVKDSDYLRDEIDLSLTPDESIPLGIEDDDYDSEGDILILEEFLSKDSLSLPENESFHFDIPSSPRPLAKRPDDDEIEPNSRILTIKVESGEFIKSSVENLVPSLIESEDECEFDVPPCDDFTAFSNLLFDADDDFSSSDDKSFSDKDILKEIYSNRLFDKEIISIKIDPHHFNAEELILLKSIPPGIDEADCNPEEEILRIEKLFDSLRDEIDLSLTPDESIPLGIKDDDYDSEGDILILEEFLSKDSLSLSENESFHFDIPSSSRPPAKRPDDDEIEPNSRILTIKVVGDISEHYVPMPRLLPTQPTLASNQEKSPHLLSHRGLKAFQLPSRSLKNCLTIIPFHSLTMSHTILIFLCLIVLLQNHQMGLEAFQHSAERPRMIINGKNTPLLDVPLFYFYPLDQLKYGGIRSSSVT